MMEIRELQLFQHLATTLHFGRTSRACNITPSALTRLVQRLESRVGIQLFLRDNRKVSLTPAGERFRRYAEETIQQWQLLQTDLAAGEKTLRGDIAIYCSVTAVYGILPQIIEKFRQTHPKVKIHLQTGDAASSLSKLRNGEVEVAIAALPEKLPQYLQFHQLMETPLLFIAAEQYQGQNIDWQRTPMIMAEKGVERQRLDKWLKEREITPTIYAQVAGNEAILAMVSLGCGIGTVPALVLEKSPFRDRVTILNVSPALPPLAVGICIMQSALASPVLQAFFCTAREESRSVPGATASGDHAARGEVPFKEPSGQRGVLHQKKGRWDRC
jgi:LysR family positive regulator for ilvC